MFIKKIKNLAIILLTVSFIFIIANIVNQKEPQSTKIDESCKNTSLQKEHIVTVFVHGTLFNYPSFKIFKKTLNDKENNNGFFIKYKNNLRYTGIYKCQPINDFGLIPINFNETNKKTKNNSLLANLYKSNFLEIKKDKNIDFHFYTFGWDGKLDKRKREEWGFKLYEQLKKEIDKIKKEKNISNIKVEILAHSHGGNVALNLVPAEEKFKKNLVVDRLILFGTPVQTETKDFVKSPIFKKIYNIYSRGDTIQVLDIVSTKSAHSKRRFEDSQNLVQIEIEVDNFKPLHNELWLSGKKSNFIYRKKFPLHPLPVFVFAPIITNFIEDNIENPKNLDLKIKTKNNDLKFRFCNNDLKHEKNKDSKNANQKITTHSCLLKNVDVLKNQIKR